MNPRRFFLSHALLLAGALLATPVWAGVQVRGVKFAETTELAQEVLHLNGAGVRVKVILDVYAAGLYVLRNGSDPQSLVAQPGPKSMQIVLLRELTGEDFADAMIKGFKANNSAAEVSRYQPQLDEIRNLMLAFGPVKKGTAIHIDYVPGKGTHVLVDGKPRGPQLPGDDFNQALLRIWLGPKPVDSDLKQALLGAGRQ